MSGPRRPRRRRVGAAADLEAGRGPRRRAWVAGVTTPMTDRRGLEHEVGGEELAAGRAAGWYRTLCGQWISPVALTESPGAPCVGCVVELDPGPELALADAQAQRRVWARWLHRLAARPGPLRVPGPVSVVGSR